MKNFWKLMKDNTDHMHTRLDHFFTAPTDTQTFWQEVKKYKRKLTKSSIDGVTWFIHFSCMH